MLPFGSLRCGQVLVVKVPERRSSARSRRANSPSSRACRLILWQVLPNSVTSAPHCVHKSTFARSGFGVGPGSRLPASWAMVNRLPRARQESRSDSWLRRGAGTLRFTCIESTSHRGLSLPTPAPLMLARVVPATRRPRREILRSSAAERPPRPFGACCSGRG